MDVTGQKYRLPKIIVLWGPLYKSALGRESCALCTYTVRYMVE